MTVRGSIPDRSMDGAGSALRSSAAKPRVAAGAGGLAVQTSAPKSGRSIPAGVRREVWRRDQGCCTYVDRHTGRRCGSRFFLELDHIVSVARGGAAEPGNLRGSPSLPARSTTALRSARLGDVSAVAAPELTPRSCSIPRIASAGDHLLVAEPRAPTADQDLDQSAALVAVRAVAPTFGFIVARPFVYGLLVAMRHRHRGDDVRFRRTMGR